MGEKRQRKPMFIIEDLETLKVLTDPLRMQILVLLDPEPQTVNQVAEKLGLSSSRLYYHFNMLEDHGLIEVIQTRTINNMIEKLYWVTAEDIDINKELLNFSSETGQENITNMISSSLEVIREDIMRSLQARKFHLEQGGKPNPRNMIMVNSKKRLKDKIYQQFITRLNAFIKEFNELPEETESGEDVNIFSLACYLYPSFYFDEESDKKERK
jgi:DNA-binding transcriptional ArsR family regulator